MRKFAGYVTSEKGNRYEAVWESEDELAMILTNNNDWIVVSERIKSKGQALAVIRKHIYDRPDVY